MDSSVHLGYDMNLLELSCAAESGWKGDQSKCCGRKAKAQPLLT